jgi:mRNA interferase RelE/StbE
LAWRIEYADRAAKVLRKLDARLAKRIFDYMDHRVAASGDPRQLGIAMAGEKSGYWRYRVGDYRVICELEDARLVVLVVEVGHRGDVYR